MVKKLLVWGIAILMIFSLVACAKEDEWVLLESSECHPIIEPSNVYWDNIGKSTTAYEEAITQFTVNGEFTEDFGGVFIDNNGIYVICVVGDLAPVESDYLIYKQVENSYNSLESIIDEIGGISQEYSVWMAETCHTCNKVLICLEDKSKISLLVEYLNAKNLYKKGTLDFFIGNNEIALN